MNMMPNFVNITGKEIPYSKFVTLSTYLKHSAYGRVLQTKLNKQGSHRNQRTVAILRCHAIKEFRFISPRCLHNFIYFDLLYLLYFGLIFSTLLLYLIF